MGQLNPHGLTTTFHFEYGLTTSYGLTTPPQNRSGNTPQNVSANISNLMANRVYHFRIVASNAAGTRFGADRTFTTLTATGPPVVTTNQATNVTSSSATLNGLLNPHGLSTSVNFQYGPTTSYGSTTPAQTQNGNTYRNIACQHRRLNWPTATYHFRIIATNMGWHQVRRRQNIYHALALGALTAGLQKVSAGLEASKPAPQVVNNPWSRMELGVSQLSIPTDGRIGLRFYR